MYIFCLGSGAGETVKGHFNINFIIFILCTFEFGYFSKIRRLTDF